jgi:D-alanyl-lipoteichoic acid acyltransferase DltB (MBOAT superfamily)
MDNFRTPYLSTSIREFWTRWHISLSTWFRDYLYIPLGGNRVKVYRWYLNLFIVFVVSGFWHGANWTFLIWGALHGSYLVGEILIKKIGPLSSIGQRIPNRLKQVGAVFLTFHLTLLAWVFFRANQLADAWIVLQKIGSLAEELNLSLIKETLIAAGGINWGFTALLLLAFALFDPIMDRFIKSLKQESRIPAGKWVFASLVSLMLLFGYFGEVQFIYFQF